MEREEAIWGVRVKCISDGLCGRIVTPYPDEIMGCEVYLDNNDKCWKGPEELERISDIDIIRQSLEDIFNLTNPDGDKQIDIATVHVKAKDAIEYIDRYMNGYGQYNTYFYPRVSFSVFIPCEEVWNGNEEDLERKKLGLIFETEEECKKKCNLLNDIVKWLK